MHEVSSLVSRDHDLPRQARREVSFRVIDSYDYLSMVPRDDFSTTFLCSTFVHTPPFREGVGLFFARYHFYLISRIPWGRVLLVLVLHMVGVSLYFFVVPFNGLSYLVTRVCVMFNKQRVFVNFILFITREVMSLFPDHVTRAILFLLLQCVRLILYGVNTKGTMLQVSNTTVRLLVHNFRGRGSIASSTLPKMVSNNGPLR